MWVLVVGNSATLERPEGGMAVLSQLGCRVETMDLWDELEHVLEGKKLPNAVLIEALDQVDAGRAALVRIRSHAKLRDVPVLIAITVNAIQRIQAHDGFDDFVLMPYVPAELYMRVRRGEWQHSDFSTQETLKIGAINMDLAGHEVFVNGRPVDMTQQEFALLRFLAEHRGRVFRRDQLLERVWGVDYYGTSRTVDIHVRRLRMKLGDAAPWLQTIRGVGYKMRGPSEKEGS